MNPQDLRLVLGVRHCVTCGTDVMVLDEGYCPWCVRCPDTGGIVDPEEWRRERWRRNSRAKRARDKEAA